MKRVRHPNLLGMLGCRLQSEPYLLLLEFQSGGSLEDWLLINDTDDFQKFQIMHQVACGMTSLHELSIVHRWYYRGTLNLTHHTEISLQETVLSMVALKTAVLQ